MGSDISTLPEKLNLVEDFEYDPDENTVKFECFQCMSEVLVNAIEFEKDREEMIELGVYTTKT